MTIPRFRPRREVGSDPDYRFTLANERTYLAWIRTSLALIAGGLAVVQVIPDFGTVGGRETLAGLLIALGTVLTVGSMRRWATAEEAMRQKFPIPATRLPIVLGVGIIIITGVAAALLVLN